LVFRLPAPHIAILDAKEDPDSLVVIEQFGLGKRAMIAALRMKLVDGEDVCLAPGRAVPRVVEGDVFGGAADAVFHCG
jgi:hypothetical protein